VVLRWFLSDYEWIQDAIFDPARRGKTLNVSIPSSRVHFFVDKVDN